MTVFLTYDLDRNHTEVKQTLISKYNFSDTITGPRLSPQPSTSLSAFVSIDLPNTTLFSNTQESAHSAVAALKAAAALWDATVEKYLVVERTENASWLAYDLEAS